MLVKYFRPLNLTQVVKSSSSNDISGKRSLRFLEHVIQQCKKPSIVSHNSHAKLWRCTLLVHTNIFDTKRVYICVQYNHMF